MIEKSYEYAVSDTKHIEKLIDVDQVMINHMILTQGDFVPDHHANSLVHMIIVRGTLTLELGEQQPHSYNKGNIVNIPYGTFMKVRNDHAEVCEFFVVKAPSPRVYEKQ